MKKSCPEENLLFACARQRFLEEHRQLVLDICVREVIDWDVVYSTAKSHGLAPLIYSNLRQLNLDLPPNIIEQFNRSFYSNIVRKERRRKKLKEVLAFFNKKSIEVMLIKGAALDILVYEQPWYTTPHDIDLVIRPRKEALPDQTRTEIMNFLYKSGIEYDYFEHHDVVMNGTLPVDFCRVWKNATVLEWEGQQVAVMSTEDMLISLCVNSCRKRFFRLKALCDIAETIDKFSDLNWPQLIARARSYQCQHIVYTALLVTRMTLGCNVPQEVLDNLAANSMRAIVIRYLSRRSSLSSFASLYTGKSLFRRHLDWSLLLSYTTYRWDQIWRRIKFVWQTRSAV